MANTRWPTKVRTSCSTKAGLRASSKHPAKRSTSPIARSARPSSSAPASEVILPPSKPATTRRFSTGANSNRSALHSVCTGEHLCQRASLCCRSIFPDSEPRCTHFREISGLARRHGQGHAGLADRQGEGGAGALAGGAAQVEQAAVHFDQGLGERQAQAG